MQELPIMNGQQYYYVALIIPEIAVQVQIVGFLALLAAICILAVMALVVVALIYDA
jgi:hypothetical protein